MDGQSFGRAMGDAIVSLVIIAFIAGGAFFAAVWYVGGWLLRHLSVVWH